MEKIVSFSFKKALFFQNEEEKAYVKEKIHLQLKANQIAKEMLDFGLKYEAQIKEGHETSVSIELISEEVGYGAFTKDVITKGSYIGEYVGCIRPNPRVYFAPLNPYCYQYPVQDHLKRNFVIDATEGNFTRFINHSEKANIKPFYTFCGGLYHVIFIAQKKIQKKEQLLYDYGKNYWLVRSPPVLF